MAGRNKKLEWNEEDALKVERSVFAGWPDESIARELGTSVGQLKKTYADELALGSERVVRAISDKVIDKALEGNVAAQKLALSRRSSAWVEKKVEEKDLNINVKVTKFTNAAKAVAAQETKKVIEAEVIEDEGDGLE